MTSRFNAPQQAETKMRRYVVGFLTKCAQAGLSEDEARRLIEESAMARGARQYEKDMRRRRRRDIAKSALGVLLASVGAIGGSHIGRQVGSGHPFLGGLAGAAAGIAGNKMLSTMY